MVHKLGGILSGYDDLSHMRDIKHTAGIAHGIVLLLYRGILDRHIKACKRAHKRPERHMAVM